MTFRTTNYTILPRSVRNFGTHRHLPQPKIYTLPTTGEIEPHLFDVRN